MLFYILICIYHKGKSKEPYGKCMNFLQKVIPIDRRDDDGNQNINEMYKAFDNYNVTYKEKEDIVQKNNKEFTKIGIYLRKKWINYNSDDQLYAAKIIKTDDQYIIFYFIFQIRLRSLWFLLHSLSCFLLF